MSDRKKTSWVVWIPGAVVVAFLAYPLSIGPTVWILNTAFPDDSAPDWVLWAWAYYVLPFQLTLGMWPASIQSLLVTYVNWWSGK